MKCGTTVLLKHITVADNASKTCGHFPAGRAEDIVETR